MKNVNNRILRLVTSGVLLGLATVLSMIKVFELPFGGSITLFSMLPVLVLGYMYGIKWGFVCGVVYGVLQMVLGATTTQAFVGLSGWTVPVMAFLDYILAFMVLGLSGMFKNSIKKPVLSITIGSAVAVFLRFLCHFTSGWILWGGYASDFFSSLNNSFGQSMLSTFDGQSLACMYSLIYNGAYMLPELVISIVGILAIMAVKPLKTMITQNNTNNFKIMNNRNNL